MTGEMVILCTCANETEALRIARSLVDERLAACVNVLPPVRSIYRWQGAVEEALEILITIKTTAERFPALHSRLLTLHSYETPEIIALPIADGSEPYLRWIREQV